MFSDASCTVHRCADGEKMLSLRGTPEPIGAFTKIIVVPPGISRGPEKVMDRLPLKREAGAAPLMTILLLGFLGFLAGGSHNFYINAVQKVTTFSMCA